MARDKGIDPVIQDWVIEQMLAAYTRGRRKILVQELIINGARLGFSERDIRRVLQSILMESQGVSLEQYGREMEIGEFAGGWAKPFSEDSYQARRATTYAKLRKMPPMPRLEKYDTNVSAGLGQN